MTHMQYMPLRELLKRIFPEETKARADGRCPFCKNAVDPEGFRDARSKKEFGISGLCQLCQDEVFMV